MHFSPDLKAALLWSGRRDHVDPLQPPHRALPSRRSTEAERPAASRTQPEHGCVEWYFYDERSDRNRGT